jgi:hypothetical protein
MLYTPAPADIRPINCSDSFHFDCHPGVDCFTECCRELDLALTPYDVIRLKKRLGIHSGSFLEQYVIIEWDEQQVFPTCYLTMVDDGRASCVFVDRNKGCRVYPDRPGACRAYPVGRGVCSNNGTSKNSPDKELFVLVKEPHCHGFSEEKRKTPVTYLSDQKLEKYNRYNDALTELLQHEQIRQGFRLNRKQLDDFILALYNLDTFRREMSDGRITMNRPLRAVELQGLAGDDEEMLKLGISWLLQSYFSG